MIDPRTFILIIIALAGWGLICFMTMFNIRI